MPTTNVYAIVNNKLGYALGGIPNMETKTIRLVLLVTAVTAAVFVVGSGVMAREGLEYPGTGRFGDDDGSVHEASIEAMAYNGIMEGCNLAEALFCPSAMVSRAQFAAFLDRALDLPETDTDFFADDDDNPYEESINRVASAKITLGCGVDSYCPDRLITRAQMATLLVNAIPRLAPVDDLQNYFSDDDDNRHENNINTIAYYKVTLGCGDGVYCPHSTVRSDQMASFLSRAFVIDPLTPPSVPWRVELVMRYLRGGNTDLQALPGDDRLFLVTRDGWIRIVDSGSLLSEPFLDIRTKIRMNSSEEGMLGLAFHPDYENNRKFYVFYTDEEGDSQVYEYRTTDSNPNIADPTTARHIITFEQRERVYVHKGGQMQFGADGYLYIAVGDGNTKGDPNEDGENPHTELGTIVRIDVDNGDPYAIPPDNPFADGRSGLPEVWAYGLRNPWRFSFDDGNIYIADVGRYSWEEVNIADASAGGLNYGWDIMEGTHCHEPRKECDPTGTYLPQVEYSHDEGVSVIGGYVYRGSAIPEMAGRYFYADFASSLIRTFKYEDGEITEHYDWSRSVERPRPLYTFGVDGHGELYILGGWSLWKIVPND